MLQSGNDFVTDRVQRGITQKVKIQELWFLRSTRRIMLVNIFIKFHEDTLNGFQVTERKRLCVGQCFSRGYPLEVPRQCFICGKPLGVPRQGFSCGNPLDVPRQGFSCGNRLDLPRQCFRSGNPLDVQGRSAVLVTP